MIDLRRPLAVVACALALAACQSGAASLPRGEAAYAVVPAAAAEPVVEDYRLGPLDVINVNVFQEPELTLSKVAVDAGGSIALPLIGQVRAAGKTASEVGDEIAARLRTRFIRNPQVSVTVETAQSQRITVEGQVVEPGVYDIASGTTLLEAIARAKSPTPIAKLDEVVVFRIEDGQRLGARFDLGAIRAGRAPDPRLRGGDTVVVGLDNVRGTWRDFLQTAPFFSLFRIF